MPTSLTFSAGNALRSKTSSVFLSYSRKDKAFVIDLSRSLSADGRSVWIDTDDYPLVGVLVLSMGSQRLMYNMQTPKWLNEIYLAIEHSDTFVSVLSPDAVGSELWSWELLHACAIEKRIVCIQHKPVNESLIPEVIDVNKMLSVDADSIPLFLPKIIELLDANRAGVITHTAILNEALEWVRFNYESWLLLSGNELSRAQKWCESNPTNPSVCDVQRDFVSASTENEMNSRRRLSITFALIATTSVALWTPSRTTFLLSAFVLPLLAFAMKDSGVRFQERKEDARLLPRRKSLSRFSHLSNY